MKNALRLALLLCLTLTGIGLGAARGKVQIAGQVVICTGEGVVIRTIPGQPAQTEAHICPDMALSLLHSIVADQQSHPLKYRVSSFAPEQVEVSLVSRTGPIAAARDPPKSLIQNHNNQTL